MICHSVRLPLLDLPQIRIMLTYARIQGARFAVTVMTATILSLPTLLEYFQTGKAIPQRHQALENIEIVDSELTVEVEDQVLARVILVC